MDCQMYSYTLYVTTWLRKKVPDFPSFVTREAFYVHEKGFILNRREGND